MKKIMYVALLLVIQLFQSNLSSQVFSNDDLSINKLSTGLWVIETRDMTTMYLLEGADKALLIDTGTKCAKLDEVIRAITKKPLFVVLTHMHGDHAGNINFFSDIYMHASDTVLMQGENPYKGTIHFVEDGDIFDLNGRKIEVVHMPAHTPGSIVLLDRQSGSCFSGDAFGSGQVWLQLRPFASMQTYVNSCKRMESLMDGGITNIYCGHYPYVKKAYDKSYITAMRMLAESIIDGKATEVKEFQTRISIGGNKPMIATSGAVNIVYDAEHIK
jgi:glyoxylase-like metal-dependent hydrolase (beta-lactamase superfamily II)